MACVDLTLKEMAAVVLTGEELWLKVQEGLQATLSSPRSKPSSVRPDAAAANGELRLLAPNPFAGVVCGNSCSPASRSWPVVSAGIDSGGGAGRFGHGGPADDADRCAQPLGGRAPEPAAVSGPRRVLPSLNARYVFGRFVVGPNSRMAHAAALAVAEAGRGSTPCSSAVVSAWAKPT